MKKIFIIAMLALLSANIASAQFGDDIRDSWQKTITVPNSQAAIVEKLFTSWGKVFPGCYVEAFDKFKKTGKADKVEIYGNPLNFQVDFAPKNGFLELNGTYTYIYEGEDANYQHGDTITKSHILTAVYWNLPNGNKLFGISIIDSGEVFEECALAFYEYNAAKGTMTPRADIVKKVMTKIDNDTEIFIHLPKEGRDLKYYDYASEGFKVIKWNGNGL